MNDDDVMMVLLQMLNLSVRNVETLKKMIILPVGEGGIPVVLSVVVVVVVAVVVVVVVVEDHIETMRWLVVWMDDATFGRYTKRRSLCRIL